jgi:hypothetical protein
MNLVLLFVATFLFILLSPGIVLRLPTGGSKYIVAATHAVVFFVVLYFFGDGITNALLRAL